jgi:23S rRNA G2445 N2-methylase RlmL
VKLEDNAWPRRSEWIAAFASACRLENRATAYGWEVIVRASRNAIVLGARPAAIADPRFGYRVSDVPASLHPTLAAAAVRLAPASANDVVVDPFCGAGTILAERAVLRPYRALHGIDVNPRALAAARRNLTSFVDVTLRKTDFSALADLRPVDMIVTNPPYGRRVSSAPEAKALHRRLDDLVTRALTPGGWLVVFRPLEFPAPTSLEIVSERKVDVGGFDVKLIAARKR